MATTSKPPVIEIRNKNLDGLTTGANTIILINGEELKGVTKMKLEIAAGGIAMMTCEIIGDFRVNLMGEFEQKVITMKVKE